MNTVDIANSYTVMLYMRANMASTSHFETVLSFERCSVADEYYERSASLVFQKDESEARIEVRCLSSSISNFFGKEDGKQDEVEKAQIITAPKPRLQIIDLETRSLDTLFRVGYKDMTHKHL